MLRFAPHRSRGSRPAAAPRPLVCARWGGCGPPRASLRCAGSRAPPEGLRPGAPAPLRGPPGPPGAALRSPQTRYCVRAWAGGRAGCLPAFRARRPPFLRTPRAAGPGPLPLPSPAPARRARRRFAGPVRRLRPRFARRARPRGSPPALPLGLVRRCAAPAALAAAAARALPSLRCGLPVRSPLLRFGRGPWASRRPAGSPPPRPLRGFGAAGSRPGGLRGPSGRLSWAFGPRGFGCAPAPARACCGLWRAAAVALGFSPAAPPPRPPPLGAPGVPGARLGGLRPPLRGSRFSRPSCGPPGALRAPRCADFGAVDSPKTVNRGLHEVCARPAAALPLSGSVKAQAGRAARGLDIRRVFFCPAGLTFPARSWYIGVPGPVPLLRGPPLRGVHGRQKPLGLIDQAAFFYAPGAPQPCRKSAPLLAPAALSHLILGPQSFD